MHKGLPMLIRRYVSFNPFSRGGTSMKIIALGAVLMLLSTDVMACWLTRAIRARRAASYSTSCYQPSYSSCSSYSSYSYPSSYSYSKLKTAKLSLLNFHLNEAQLKNLINQNSSVFNYMKDEGADGRVVSEIWVVVDAEISEAVDLSRTINVGAKFNKNNQLNVKFNLKSGKQHTISISTGSVFAYKLHKVTDWDKRRKKATKVTDMKADYKGMG